MDERRKSRRQEISRQAKIQTEDGSPPRDCIITNISDGGVRLRVGWAEIPDRFVLLLSEVGAGPRPRDCKVIWRLGHELGARFTGTFGRDHQAQDTAPQPAVV